MEDGCSTKLDPFKNYLLERVAATLVPNAVLKVYPGGSHGLIAINADADNADLLDFLKA